MATHNITRVRIGDQHFTLSERTQGHIQASVSSRNDELIYNPETGALTVQQLRLNGIAYSRVYNELVKQAPMLVYQPNEGEIVTTARVYQKIVYPKLNPGYPKSGIFVAAASVNALTLVKSMCGVKIGWDQAVRHMGVGGGTLSLGLSAVDLYNARNERNEALKMQSKEGCQKATAKVVGAVTGVIASLFYILGKANELNWVGLSLGTVTAISAVCTTFWSIGAIVAIALASYGIYRCRTFDQRLSRFDSDESGIKKALSYLLSEITVSSGEIAALGALGDGPEGQTQIDGLRERKIKYLRTRTSLRAVQMIVDRAPQLLRALNSGVGDLDEAKALLADIRYEGFKKKVVYTIGLIASIIGILGVLLGFYVSLGALPLILIAGSAGISLLVTLCNAMAHLQYSRNAPRPLSA